MVQYFSISSSVPCSDILAGFCVGCVPSGPKQVKRLGEDVVIDKSGVHREHAHEEDDVATRVQGHEHLIVGNNRIMCVLVF